MSIVRLGSFETVREVGSGGMGTVWEGRHVVTGAPVAVKFLTSARARDPRWLTAFHAEARAIARLAHPRVVRIHDLGTLPASLTMDELPAGSPYLVMEWVPNCLHDLPRPLAWESVRAILLEILDALAHIHARNIVHRDIKPSNVLGKVGRLRVADFGIARVDDASEQAISGVSGTPFFMAPEQFTSSAGRVGAWTDLYAVGCLAHLLVTGSPPFQGSSVVELANQHLNDAFPTRDLDDEFAAWLTRITSKNPAARYRFASEAARELAPIPRAFRDPSVAATERWISPELTATDTVPLTTVLIDMAEATLSAPIRGEAAGNNHLPAYVPDWRTSDEIRSHIEHVRGAGLAVSTMRVPPFVGREAERDLLWDAFREKLLAGEPSATLITGPSGIGKTRLAGWMAERAHELALAPHLGPVSCRSTDDPFVRMALDELGVKGDDVDRIQGRVEQRLSGAAVTTTELNAIVHFLSGHLAASAPRELLDAMRASLAVCAGGRPLVILLDDVDEAPPEVLEAIYHTIRTGELVHFVMTAAKGIPDPHHRFENVPLGPLDDAYVARIVRDVAGLHEDLAMRVVAVAQRNPGRAIRLVHGLVERGALRAGEHGFELLSDATVEAPDAASLWSERLEQLIRQTGSTARAALEVATVLGDEVSDDEWKLVATAANVFIPPTLAGELDQRGFVTSTTRGWSFADPELRNLIVQSARDRNTWKTYVAAARHALPDADLVRQAFWSLEAGGIVAAAEGFIEAARAAESVCQTSRAARLLTAAEQAIARMDAGSERFTAEVDVLKAAIWGLERLDEADELAARVVDVSASHGWDDLLGRALERRAKFARKRVDLDAADRLYRLAHEAFVRCGDIEGQGFALQGLGMVAVSRGALREAETIYNDALVALLSARALRGAAWCANGLGDVYRLLDEHGLAVHWYARALNWFEQVGNSYGAMWCVHDLALTKRARGDLDGAASGLADTIRMAKRLGQRVVAPRLNLGIIHVQRGHEELARPIFEEVLEESRLRGVLGEQGIAHACLLPCDAAVARWDDVRSNLAGAREKLGGLVDADLGRMASVAAEYAAHAGEPALTRELDEFAKSHAVL